MPDLLDQAIAEATQAPGAGELVRKSRRYDELRQSTAWTELREEVKQRREKVVQILGLKALKGVDSQELRDEGIYSRGFLDGIETLLDLPDDVEQRLETLITQSYNRIRDELIEAAEEESPYA